MRFADKVLEYSVVYQEDCYEHLSLINVDIPPNAAIPETIKPYQFITGGDNGTVMSYRGTTTGWVFAVKRVDNEGWRHCEENGEPEEVKILEELKPLRERFVE
jgi:hypothetical protein